MLYQGAIVFMNKFWDKISSLEKVSYKELAENLYEVLVLDGGPSSPDVGQEPRLNAVTLGIQADKMERFIEKRRLTYDALLWLAVEVGTEEQTELLQKDLGEAVRHPLAMEIETLIGEMWRERGIDVPDVSTICFNEVDGFFEQPFQWGREWLDEFSADEDMSGKHYIKWTDQWRKDFEAMRTVVEAFS